MLFTCFTKIFCFGFPGFSGSSTFRNWSPLEGTGRARVWPCHALGDKGRPRFIIEMCLWLASKISLHFNVLCFGSLGIFNSGFHAMPDSSIADQQPRCRASISGWRTAWPIFPWKNAMLHVMTGEMELIQEEKRSLLGALALDFLCTPCALVWLEFSGINNVCVIVCRKNAQERFEDVVRWSRMGW